VCVYVKSKVENNHIKRFYRYWLGNLLDVMNGEDFMLKP